MRSRSISVIILMHLHLHQTIQKDPKIRAPQKNTKMVLLLVTYLLSPPEIPGEALEISSKLRLSCELVVSATDDLVLAVIFTCIGTSLSQLLSFFFFFLDFLFCIGVCLWMSAENEFRARIEENLAHFFFYFFTA